MILEPRQWIDQKLLSAYIFITKPLFPTNKLNSRSDAINPYKNLAINIRYIDNIGPAYYNWLPSTFFISYHPYYSQTSNPISKPEK